MAHGRIDIENIGNQVDLAAEQLGTEHYAGHVRAAQGEAADLPDLGQELEDVWAEILELTRAMQISNGYAQNAMYKANEIMYGNPDMNQRGVISYAEELLRYAGRLGTTIRDEFKALGGRATPILEKYEQASDSTETLNNGLASQTAAVEAVGALTAKLFQNRFGQLVQTANRANDRLDDYVKEI